MRRFLLAVCLVLVMGAASADTFRFAGGVVSVGDSVAALLQRAGPPTRTLRLENDEGAAIGERWDYFIGSKLVSFEISGGVVLTINESR